MCSQELDDRASILSGGYWWDFFFRHRIQATAGAHPASYPMGTGGSFSVYKEAGMLNWRLNSI
jgi:hypothetical protein